LWYRPDSEESHLRMLAYQALSNLASYSAQDSFEILLKLAETILSYLEQSLALMTEKVNLDDSIKIMDIQSHFCTVLQVNADLITHG
jgi:hypothetical protein